MTIPRLYTYQEVATAFQVHPRTVYNWARHLPKFKLGNTVRLPEAVVQQLFQEHFGAKSRVKRTPRPRIPPSLDTRTARNRP